MSDIDLAEAAQEVRSLLARRWNMSPRNGDIVADADAILTAALPHIARQVREQVADEIKTASKTLEYDDDEARVLHIAARIARGEQS